MSFGLVSIPVKLYSTNETRAGVGFNLLHGKCGSRLKQQYICPKDEEIVERDQMVKGYEFAKGQYVTFSEEELKTLEEQASEAIEITEFVPETSVSSLYFDKAYYLGPDKGGPKAYSLLAEAMRQTGRAALAKYSARGKQYLVMVRVQGRGLVMQQLRYADEVKPMSEVPLDETPVSDRELDLAVKLIEQITVEGFEPEKYEDEVRKRTLALIDKKVAGEDIVAAPAEAPQAKVIDLMEALKASLAGKGAAPPKSASAANDDEVSAGAGAAKVELERKSAKKSTADKASGSGRKSKSG